MSWRFIARTGKDPKPVAVEARKEQKDISIQSHKSGNNKMAMVVRLEIIIARAGGGMQGTMQRRPRHLYIFELAD
jgi:hypothetical protein